MGRDTGPVCKRCRREGQKLFLKGTRCYMAKCPIETGRPAPGVHGMRRGRKLSDYGIQLREKQRLRRQYGLREDQFILFFKQAARKRGVTGEVLLQRLELRLDNLVYLMGLAGSRAAARQFVTHNHVTVNGGKANVPSMVLEAGDEICVRDREKSRVAAAKCLETAATRETPAWLAVDEQAFTGKVVRVPSRDEIAPIVNEQLIVELYSK